MPAKTLKKFLDENNVRYVTIQHSKAYTAQDVAASSHISGKEIAKTVMVKLGGKMAMAVVPACSGGYRGVSSPAPASTAGTINTAPSPTGPSPTTAESGTLRSPHPDRTTEIRSWSSKAPLHTSTVSSSRSSDCGTEFPLPSPPSGAGTTWGFGRPICRRQAHSQLVGVPPEVRTYDIGLWPTVTPGGD